MALITLHRDNMRELFCDEQKEFERFNACWDDYFDIIAKRGKAQGILVLENNRMNADPYTVYGNKGCEFQHGESFMREVLGRFHCDMINAERELASDFL